MSKKTKLYQLKTSRKSLYKFLAVLSVMWTTNEWFEVDANMPAFEVLTDDEILMCVQVVAESVSDSDDEWEGSDECVSEPKVIHGTALNYVEGLLDYLEGQEDTLVCDKLVLCKIR